MSQINESDTSSVAQKKNGKMLLQRDRRRKTIWMQSIPKVVENPDKSLFATSA